MKAGWTAGVGRTTKRTSTVRALCCNCHRREEDPYGYLCDICATYKMIQHRERSRRKFRTVWFPQWAEIRGKYVQAA